MSATDTSYTGNQKKTGVTPESFAEFFKEAMRNYEKVLKTGIQLQEESMNLWKDVLTNLGSPEEFRTKLESLKSEALPQARQRMQEFLEAFNRTNNKTIDLFEKTVSVYQATSATDAQRRVNDLVDSSLDAMRVNVHAAVDTNAKIVSAWRELVARFGRPR
jgi:hypothetical protein